MKEQLTPTEPYAGLARAIGAKELVFKREDLHPLGSHKGRSIPMMIDYYFEQGDRNFAISSSGNAAIAAARHVKLINQKSIHPIIAGPACLDVFIGQNISRAKLDDLKSLADENIRILSKERPLQALNAAIQEGARSLRQSTDDVALIGYKSLALELDNIERIGAIFIGTSSGTTAQALAQYFSSSKKDVQIHMVQTSSCHPMSDAFESYDGPQELSIADAIVDQTARRKDALIPLIKKTGGHAWFATNEEIERAISLVKEHALIDISTNSALSVVGVMQAAYRGWEFKGAVVCLICGK